MSAIPSSQLNFTGESVGNGKYGVIFRYEWQDIDVGAQRAAKERFFADWDGFVDYIHPNIGTHCKIRDELLTEP